MWNPLNWLSKAVLEKWIGRLVVIGLAALGGVLIDRLKLPPDLVNNWIEAGKALAEPAITLLVAWLLGMLRYNKALAKMPGAQ